MQFSISETIRVTQEKIPPRVGWDVIDPYAEPEIPISIHPPRVGWDAQIATVASAIAIFQSTHPVWGGTCSV